MKYDQSDFWLTFNKWKHRWPSASVLAPAKMLPDLLGETIVTVEVADTVFGPADRELQCIQDSLVFGLQNGSFFLLTLSGDGCSESWFADAFGLPGIVNKPVTGISVVHPQFGKYYNVHDGRTRRDYDEIYSFRIDAGGSTAVITFRNSVENEDIIYGQEPFRGGWLNNLIKIDEERQFIRHPVDGSISFQIRSLQRIESLDVWMAD